VAPGNCFCRKIARQQELGKEVFRANVAFAKPEIYEALEEQGVKYAIRLLANDSLLRDIEEHLMRPMRCHSRIPIVWYKGFLYQAASWRTARSVVAVVKFQAGELFSRLGCIVTNLETPAGRRYGSITSGGLRTMDQRRQAKRRDDAAELPSFPLKPNTAGAECASLQLGQLVAAGVAQANPELVADDLQ